MDVKVPSRSTGYLLFKAMPTWGADLSGIDFDDNFYYLRPAEKQGKSWDEVPEDIKRTFDRLGIPEAERRFLAGVGAQYESEVVYHSLKEEWEKLGVVFLDMDSGLREHEDVVKEYFATVIPAPTISSPALKQRSMEWRQLRLCAEGRACRYSLAGIFSHQCRKYGTV